MILAEGFKWGVNPLAWEIIPRIHLGPLAISPHGIGIAVGYLVGAQLMVRRARKYGGPPEADIWNTLFYALIGAIVGARLGYVFGHFGEVTKNGDDLLGVFKVYQGGISLIGGITGAILAGLPYMIKKKMGFWRTMDLAAPGLALGIVIGRIGDLIIGDHLGKPTSFALGWHCLGEAGGPAPVAAAQYRAALERGSPPSLGCYDLPLHQTALYDFVSTILLLCLLLWLGKRVRKPGFMILVFTIWYGTMRVITDFLRVDKRYVGLTGSQIMSGLAVLACMFLLARFRGAPPRWAAPMASGTTTYPSTTLEEGAAEETEGPPPGVEAAPTGEISPRPTAESDRKRENPANPPSGNDAP